MEKPQIKWNRCNSTNCQGNIGLLDLPDEQLLDELQAFVHQALTESRGMETAKTIAYVMNTCTRI